MSAIFQKNLSFNSNFVLILILFFYLFFFLKNTLRLALTKVLKSMLIFIILQIAEIPLFLIKSICLAENVKAMA